MQDQNSSTVAKLRLCGRVFTPSSAISSIDLFRGRKEIRDRLIAAITARGKHAILFGDRGVGKTSIANILKASLEVAGESIQDEPVVLAHHFLMRCE